MWTDNAHFIIVYIRAKRFMLPIVLPIYIINALICELGDLVNFFTFFNKKITGYVDLIETTIYSLSEFKRYDFVDISLESKKDKEKAKIKICTR